MGSESGGADEELIGGYSELKDLRLEIIDGPDFSFCFWVFLLDSTSLPSTILLQGSSDFKHNAPFLILNKEKKLMVFSSHILYEGNIGSTFAMELSCSSEEGIPLGKWVHVGAEVSTNSILLHVDGKVVGEKHLDSMQREESDRGNCRRDLFAFVDQENGGIRGYIHDAKILPLSTAVKDRHAKDPPLQLFINISPASEIQENSDGVWSIVYDKELCKNDFSVDVSLLNAFGQLVDKGIEVAASLIYADDQEHVKKPDDAAESPLLISNDGIVFSSSGISTKLTHGCATVKLKISQLSSRCDNRLFRLRFNITKMETLPFFKAISPPIRCLSRNPVKRASTFTWKRLPSGFHLVNGSSSPAQANGNTELQQNGVCQAISNPASKRVKLGSHGASEFMKVDRIQEHKDEECDSHTFQASKARNTLETSLGNKQENFGETQNRVSEAESVGASFLTNKLWAKDIISELTVFKYCLGNISERSSFLKDVIPFASDEQLADLAEQVYLYSGCARHRHQISIAKRMFEEGETAWNSISQHNRRVNWDNVVSEIEELFMKISCCNTRSLSQQDINILRRISGCDEYMARENFDKMWRWLYPVAYTISRDGINRLWASTTPKWIEGFITKEEVEYALQSPVSLQGPGTFIIRFPTSRSWPHPDAGSLVVTYVSRDYALRHSVLSLDYSCGKSGAQIKSLEELLLAEPELSRLARIRSST